MAILYAANLWVNRRGQAGVPVQEDSKAHWEHETGAVKRNFSLGFHMKWVIVLDLGFASSGPVFNLDVLTGLNLKLC